MVSGPSRFLFSAGNTIYLIDYIDFYIAFIDIGHHVFTHLPGHDNRAQ
jgi:hypothetical protein